jgi:O-antigen/teichoic acid export membrane protein
LQIRPEQWFLLGKKLGNLMSLVEKQGTAGTTIGRGTLYLAVGQALFILSGYLVNAGLGRLLGPESYGIFSIIVSLIVITETLTLVGVPKALAKYVAEHEDLTGHLVRKAGKIQGLVSLAVFALLFISAQPLASLLNDPQLSDYIRLSSFLIPVAALNHVNSSALNGRRFFGRQALALSVFCVSRVFLTFGAVYLGLGVKGALGGLILATALAALVARYLNQPGQEAGTFPLTKLIHFAVQFTLFECTISLLARLDLILVKAMLGEGIATGLYASAVTLARIPRFIVWALSMALFPSIADSVARGDSQRAAAHIRHSLRIGLLVLLPVTVLLSTTSEFIVAFVYGESYLGAASAFSILVFGLGLLALFDILTTAAMASGGVTVAMVIGLALVPVDVVLNLSLIPTLKLQGAALATTLTALIGSVVAAMYVFARFKTQVPWLSLARILLASGILYFIARAMPFSGSWLPVSYVSLALIYALSLLLLGEIRLNELKSLKTALLDQRKRGRT